MKLKEIKKILSKTQTIPSKKLGQNFLIKEKIIKKIIEIAKIKPTDTILEIGPGPGNLTQELAKKAKMVVAVEKDPKMVEIAKMTLNSFKNVKIIQGNILQFTSEELQLTNDYKVIANLPFYLTGAVIKKFLEEKNPPKEMILMVQKEVAQRICARPPKMNVLALFVQFYAKASLELLVPKDFFWPKPKVDAAIVKIVLKKTYFPPRFREYFFKIVKAGFSHPRKQLINNLTSSLGKDKIEIKKLLLKNGINPSQRAENLSLETWLKLTKFLISFPK